MAPPRTIAPVTPLEQSVPQNQLPCVAEGCDKPRRARGLCRDHAARYYADRKLAAKYAQRGETEQSES